MLVALVDSHPAFLNALASIVNRSISGLDVVLFSSVDQFASKNAVLPDLTILGVNQYPTAYELLAIDQMIERNPKGKFIIYYGESQMAIPFLNRGISGFVAKSSSPSEFINYVQTVLNPDSLP